MTTDGGGTARTLPVQRHESASKAGQWAFLLVVVVGLVAVGVDATQTTSEVVDTATTAAGGTATTAGGTPQATADFDIWQELFSPGFRLFLQAGVVILAAFAAGGLAQRAILGQFAVKIAGFELPALAEEAGDIADLAAINSEKLAEVQATTIDVDVRVTETNERIDALIKQSEEANEQINGIIDYLDELR